MDLVYVVRGEVFQRQRFIRELAFENEKKGRKVLWVDASIPGAVENAKASTGFIDNSSLMLVVSNPEKVPVDTYDTKKVVFILDLENGTPEFENFVKTLNKKCVKIFDQPEKDYQNNKFAESFIRDEFLHRGIKNVDDTLIALLIRMIGYNPGMLSYEIDKVLKYTEGQVPLASDMSKVLSTYEAGNVNDLIQALGNKNYMGISREFQRVIKKTECIPIIRMIFNAANKWSQVAFLREAGLTPNEIADKLHLNQWVLNNTILPQMKMWTFKETIHLIKDLGEAERNQLSGGLDPNSFLLCKLLKGGSGC